MSAKAAGAADYHVDIVPTADGCRVTPAAVGARKGEKIEWHNWTAENVWLFFPGNAPIPTPNDAIAAGDSERLTVTGQKKGPHAYLVFCEETHDCAHAASHPIIIVRG